MLDYFQDSPSRKLEVPESASCLRSVRNPVQACSDCSNVPWFTKLDHDELREEGLGRSATATATWTLEVERCRLGGE